MVHSTAQVAAVQLAAVQLAAKLSAIPPAFLLAAGGCLLALLLLFCWVTLLRARLLSLSALVRSRDRTLSNLAAELEAQALLARQMSLDLDELRKSLLERKEAVQPAAALWAGPNAPVNLNRPGQILRLSRKGKSVAEIASDLNVSQGEVELLLKVHDLGQKGPNQENADVLS